MSRHDKTGNKKGVTINQRPGNLVFDAMIQSNKSNRPTAAKSAGIIGKWGVASFTSLRHMKTAKQDKKDLKVYQKTPIERKFFKSRISQYSETKNCKIEEKKPMQDNHNIGKFVLKARFDSKDGEKIYSIEPCVPKENNQLVRTIIQSEFTTDENIHSNVSFATNTLNKNSAVPSLKSLSSAEKIDNCSSDNKKYISDSEVCDLLLTQKSVNEHTRTYSQELKHHRSHVENDETDIRMSNLGIIRTSDSLYPSINNTKTPQLDFEKLIDSLPVAKKDLKSECVSFSPESTLMKDNITQLPVSIKSNTQFALSNDNKLENEVQICLLDNDVQQKFNILKNKMNTDADANDIWYQQISTSENIASNNDQLILENGFSQQLLTGINSKISSENDLAIDCQTYDKKVDKVLNIHNLDNESAYNNMESSDQVDLNIKSDKCLISSVEYKNEKENAVSVLKSKRIFSSRKDSHPKRATYKHKWHNNDCEESETKIKSFRKSANAICTLNNGSEPEPTLTLSKLLHVKTWPQPDDFNETPVTSLKCIKREKQLYQVVKNVKKAHQIQESGEYQEFNDDVEFLFDALQDNNQVTTRCLSCVSLASKCMKPAFRMHLRAHGTVTRFFNALHDAPQFPSLALCTSLVMFVLSQDRLNMDLDPKSLDLMLQLLDSDASHTASLEGNHDLEKIKYKVVELCSEMRKAGHAKLLNFDNITAGYLAMETLLSLTSKRAGEWFKEEVRELGGLDHILSTVQDCMQELHPSIISWSKELLEKLCKADRCLRVVENVLHENEENQLYLLRHKKNMLLHLLINLCNICILQLPSNHLATFESKDSVKWMFMDVLFTSLKVLINLTHDYGEQCEGSTLAGKIDDVYLLSMMALFEIPAHLPEDKKFDINILALSLLINLVEHCSQNRKQFLEMSIPVSLHKEGCQSSTRLLVDLFFIKQESARIQEAKTDNILDGKKDDDDEKDDDDQLPKNQDEVLEETIKKLLQKAGKHMEDTLIATYIVLLLGYIMMDGDEYQDIIKCLLPNSSLQPFLEVLNKFYNFENLTQSATDCVRGILATKKMLVFLENIQKSAPNEIPIDVAT